jgi:hypothetical protein
VQDSAGAQRSKSLQGFEENLRRSKHFHAHGETQIEEFAEEREKVEAFEKLEILPRLGRKCASSGGSNSSRQIGLEKRDLGRWFSTSRREQEERTEEEIVSRQISLRYPSVVGSARSCMRFKLREQEGESFEGVGI